MENRESLIIYGKDSFFWIRIIFLSLICRMFPKFSFKTKHSKEFTSVSELDFRGIFWWWKDSDYWRGCLSIIWWNCIIFTMNTLLFKPSPFNWTSLKWGKIENKSSVPSSPLSFQRPIFWEMSQGWVTGMRNMSEKKIKVDMFISVYIYLF